MRTQLGQLLLIDVAKADWCQPLEKLLARFEPAGIFFRRLTPATAEASRNCARSLASTPFLATSEEGGGSLSDLFAGLPPLRSLDPHAAGRAGELIGRAMALLGLNLNLAPSVDLAVSAEVGAREPQSGTEHSTGAAADVASPAEAFVQGLSRHRVLACARHFPGMPGGPGEPSSPAPVVDRPMAKLWREDLMPYRTLGGNCAMVEITHAVHKAYDYEFPRPASLSPAVVEGLLRVKLGYQGVALADASKAARAAGIELAEAVVRAVVAGCDLVLVPGEEKRLKAVFDSLERGIDLGTLTRDRVTEALGRLKKAKSKLAKPAPEHSEREWTRLQNEFSEFSKQGIARSHGID
jgi:beta-N-acetylhexosaminidase